MNRIRKIIKILFGIPLTIAAFIFIGKVFFDSWPKIQEQILDADLTLLIFGVLFMLLFFFTRSIVWFKVLRFFGESDKSISENVYHYTLAETKRYIPGNIFSFVSRIQKFSGQTHSKSTVIKGLALEAIVMVLSAFLISLPAISNSLKINNLGFVLLISFVVIVLIVILAIWQRRNLKINLRKISNFLPHKSFFEYVNVISISSLAWLFFGFSNYLFASSIFPSDPNMVLLFTSIFTLAWLIGYLSFISPMGLGVREASLIYLFSPFMPVFAATAISVFTRIFLIVSELLFLLVSFLSFKYRGLLKKHIKISPFLIVAIAGFFYVFYFTFHTIVRHYNFFSGKFDLGNMENTVWNTANGRFFIFSNPDGIGELSRLSAHSDFILVLLAPIYALFPNVSVLLVTQALVIGAGGFFVYLISKEILKSERISVLLAVGYYLNFFVQEQNIFDFHSVSLATGLLLGAFYFLIKKRMVLFLLFLFFAVLTKENVFLVSALLGGYLFIQNRRRLGSALFIGSIIAFLFLMSYAIPASRGGNDHFALDYLSYLGNTPIGIILSPLLKPLAFFGRVFSLDTFYYLYQTFLPVGFLSFFSPLYAVFLLPDFLINILSDNPNLRSIQYHYGALLVPFVYISAIFGIKKILSLYKNKLLLINIIFYYLLAFIVYSSWEFSPIPGTKNADNAPFIKVENKSAIHSSLAQIPQDASVSATNTIAAHLVQREKIYVVPHGIEFVDYVVFYKEEMDLAQELLAYNDEFVQVANTSEINDLIILKRIILLGISGKP